MKCIQNYDDLNAIKNVSKIIYLDQIYDDLLYPNKFLFYSILHKNENIHIKGIRSHL